MLEARAIIKSLQARSDSANPLIDDLENNAANKRAVFPRALDGTQPFMKDWERLSRSGRYHMDRLKGAILL